MLLVAPVQESRQLEMDRTAFDGGDDDLMALVVQPRSDVPAITHVDYSARVQTVSKEVNPEFYAVIQAFEALSGCPVLVNTSFNVRGEPIVCSPQDAYRCFMRTEMDLLVLEDCLLEKTKQAPVEGDESWRDEYELD
jgi:carbamoyltransferase